MKWDRSLSMYDSWVLCLFYSFSVRADGADPLICDSIIGWNGIIVLYGVLAFVDELVMVYVYFLSCRERDI